jgi:hypothetical protein
LKGDVESDARDKSSVQGGIAFLLYLFFHSHPIPYQLITMPEHSQQSNCSTLQHSCRSRAIKKQSSECSRTYDAVLDSTDVKEKESARAVWEAACDEYDRLRSVGSVGFDPDCGACMVSRFVRGV